MTASHPRKSARRARCLSTGHGRARPDIPPVCPQIVRQLIEFDATRRSSSNRFHRPPACWSASTPFTHLIRGTQIPIAHAAPPTCPSRGFRVWGFFCQGVRRAHESVVLRLLPSFDLRARFFVPTRTSLAPSRAEAVKVGRHTNLATSSAVARPHLDSFEHDGTPGAIGMTIRGEPACGRGSVAPQPCIRWVRRPEP